MSARGHLLLLLSLSGWSSAAWARAPCATPRACERACAAGSGEACNELGALYFMGEGVKASDRKARRYYQRACDAGELLGCANLAWMAVDGQGGPVDVGVARAHFQRACAGGEPTGCGGLGVLEATAGAGLAACPHLSLGCDAEDGRACRALGRVLTASDPAAAARAYAQGCAAEDGPSCAAAVASASTSDKGALERKACEHGQGASCARWARGLARAQPAAAIEAARRGCQLRDPQSCLLASRWARAGLSGLPPDAKGPSRWLRLGCDAGLARLCAALADQLKSEGREPLAVRLLNGLACEGGHHAACAGRMNLHRANDGLLYNKAAVRSGRLRQDCERPGRGSAAACRELADLRLTGTGVRVDQAEARALYARACRRHDSVACARLDRLLAR